MQIYLLIQYFFITATINNARTMVKKTHDRFFSFWCKNGIFILIARGIEEFSCFSTPLQIKKKENKYNKQKKLTI